MLLCADADAASADLASGVLTCPSCRAGRLRSWGWGRERAIRTGAGATRLVRPRRGRCRSCGVTHVLLPSWVAPRRADSVRVIARAAAASVLHGTGTRRLGVQLGVPASTVRGWLRRLRARSGQLLREATSEFGRLVAVIETPEGRDPAPPGPTGSPLGDALAGRQDVLVERRVVSTLGEAARYGMHGSPTILIDGSDPVRRAANPRELVLPPVPGC